MDTEEELLWLVLQRLTGGKSGQLRRLLGLSHHPGEILEADDKNWVAAGTDPELRALRRRWRTTVLDRARQDQQILRRLDAALLPLPAPDYPALLAETHDPPPLLYFRGNRELLRQPWLAVVGSRKASSMGLRAAAEFVAGLVDAGLGVCSGLALGVDAQAHRAALEAGGATCAVVATGIDISYPRRNRELTAQIAAHGLVLSEFALGSEPLRERFPQRNRIISGLSLGVLVVEAAERSGSLITARLALDQNREVFALPHSVYHSLGRGCNRLLRQGAQLAETPQDILSQLGCLHEAQRELQLASLPPHLSKLQLSLYDALGYEPASADDLAGRCRCDAKDAVGGLMELQLCGLVEARDGRYMRR